jgi:hypothetical protein
MVGIALYTFQKGSGRPESGIDRRSMYSTVVAWKQRRDGKHPDFRVDQDKSKEGDLRACAALKSVASG